MSSLENVQIFVPVSGGQSTDKPAQPQQAGCLELNNQDESGPENTLCAVLIETKNVSDEEEAKVMLESHQLLKAAN